VFSSFDAEYDRLRALLAEQIDRDALREARETVVALLCIRPNDEDALSARAFLDEQLSTAVSDRVGEIRRFDGHTGPVNSVVFSPDGRWAISGSGGALKNSDLLAQEDRSIRLWDVETGSELRRFLGLTSRVTSLAFASDGRRFLSGHHGGTMYLWDAHNANLVRRFERRARVVYSVALSPNGRRAISGGDDRAVTVWDVNAGRSLCRLKGHGDAVTSVAFSPDGTRALSGGFDKAVRVWDLCNYCQVRRFRGHLLTVTGVAFSPNGRQALSCGSDGNILLWDVETGELLRRLNGHTGPVHAVTFSTDGLRAVSASADNTLRVWDLPTGREIHCFVGHTEAVTSVALAPTGDLVALSGSRDASVRLWRLPTVVVGRLDPEALPALDDLPYATVNDLVETLNQTPLLDRAQRKELANLVQGRFTQPHALLIHLLERGWLTRYQTEQVGSGQPQDLVLGSYIILDRLGEGGMGEVFKARPIGRQGVAVLKVVRPDLLSNESIVAQFHAEIEALSRLSHPNVIRTFGAYQARGCHFFTMEYIEGTDLGKLVEQSGPLPVGQACDYIRQAALGLEHAHEHCLIHRDIKPANLLLTLPKAALNDDDAGLTPSSRTSGAVVKVIDWGLADRRLPKGHHTPTAALANSEMVGTADYLAPEQAQDASSTSIQADIYSLGCTLYHLLAGHPPFPGGSLMQKLMKHRTAEPQPIQEIRADLPAGLAAVVQKMMAKQSADRYRTPAMVAAALAPFAVTDSPG
jgi:WD40 repeat protein